MIVCELSYFNIGEIESNFKFNSFLLSLTVCSFDFEDGIGGWEKTGTAFNNQPTFGDNPTARGREPAQQQGDWWIGGAEVRPSPDDPAGKGQGDNAQGTLTSPCFVIVGNIISFLIGGGCSVDSVRAELVVNNQVENKPLYYQADCFHSSCVALHTLLTQLKGDLWRNKVVIILPLKEHIVLFLI